MTFKKMEDDLKKIGRRAKKERRPTKMGDDLTNLIFLNGRRPQK
jgi:hypothetical protein